MLRRLRALIALPEGERPISIGRLERLAGVSENEVYKVARRGTMIERTRLGLARALTLVENDQLVYRQGNRKSIYKAERADRVEQRAPRPPQKNVSRLAFTSSGPRVVFDAVNPRAFPKLDKIER